MKIDIVINTDDKFLQHAMAMLCSLYENNNKHNIVVHVLQKSLSDKSKQYLTELSEKYNNSIIYYDVDESRLQGVQFRKNRPLSMAAYYRLLLSSVLPDDLDKVLYLDCDIIVVRDIEEIFHIEIDNYALAATLDIFPYSQQHRLQLHMEADERTFCSGIMLVNLKYWREHNVEQDLLEYSKRHREVVYLHDQDVLNYKFKKHWFLLPPKWNRGANTIRPIPDNYCKDFDIIEYICSPMLFHFASVDVKPWLDAPVPCKNVYIKYLKKSGYKEVRFIPVNRLRYFKLCYSTMKYYIKLYLLFFQYYRK